MRQFFSDVWADGLELEIAGRIAEVRLFSERPCFGFQTPAGERFSHFDTSSPYMEGRSSYFDTSY